MTTLAAPLGSLWFPATADGRQGLSVHFGLLFTHSLETSEAAQQLQEIKPDTLWAAESLIPRICGTTGVCSFISAGVQCRKGLTDLGSLQKELGAGLLSFVQCPLRASGLDVQSVACEPLPAWGTTKKPGQ